MCNHKLTPAGTNEEGEQEFIGTKKQWDDDELIDTFFQKDDMPVDKDNPQVIL